jgi:outer membrane biosynthesis protein TonB
VLPDNSCDEKGIEGEELERNPEDSKEDKHEALADVEAHTLLGNMVVEEGKTGQGENPPCDNDEQIHDVAIKCVTANDKEVESETPAETTELTQPAPLLDIKDLDTVIEDVTIPKKKNKKRRKHAKKKKPGTVEQEEEDHDDEEEDVPVEA